MQHRLSLHFEQGVHCTPWTVQAPPHSSRYLSFVFNFTPTTLTGSVAFMTRDNSTFSSDFCADIILALDAGIRVPFFHLLER